MAADFSLPILVNGEPRECAPEDAHELRYETGARVLIPRLTPETAAEIRRAPAAALDDLHLDDITLFLNEVGALWADPRYPGRAEAVRIASAVTGYSPQTLEEDYTRIARTLTRAKLYDIVDADLGTSLIVDDWVPRQSVYVKARPKGRVLHLMVGNVPLAGLFTLVRSVLTKNTTVAKLPSRDPASCLYFAKAFHDVDPDHPITRSLSVVYWPGGSPAEDEFIQDADLVCAWGQGASIAAVKKKIPIDTDFLEFGPKESLHFIGAPFGDVDNLAMRAAYDISVYEQEACFSPQRMFVEGDAEEFANALAPWLDKLLVRLPVGFRSADRQAHLSRARVEAEFDGHTVVQGGDAQWTVVLMTGEGRGPYEHPLSRTIYIHPVKDLSEAVGEIHSQVQTVGVHPWSRAQELAEVLTRAGADRVTEVGLMSRPRPGFTHDAKLPLHHFVRWVTLERGLAYKGRFRDSDRGAFERKVFQGGRDLTGGSAAGAGTGTA
ncbi:aldehyde dehydrogenase family protein [Microbispora hainanensis]|uniref:aldehyde dehydrogenase family protein n=1 Tax=Microbispora hainanensis TaxID=568844 RepID=UPI0033CCA6F0